MSSSQIKNTSQTQNSSGLRSMESKHRSLTVLRCKLVIVGDACVGKSALAQVFQSGGATFPKNYMMTVGAEFSVKQVPIPDTDFVVELYMYDCAGQSIFNQLEMNAKYFENAGAIMVVYDVGNEESFQSVNKWLSAVRSAANTQDAICLLVGNKSDYRDGTTDSRAEIVKEDAVRACKELNMKYFETSAALNVDVQEPFNYIAKEFYNRYEESVSRGDGHF